MKILANRAIGFLAIGLILAPNMMADEEKLSLTLRSRTKGAPENFVEKKVNWEAGKTALIICDMWDDHWCKSAARRVGEMAGPMNKMVNAAREKGIFIIHAPSSVVSFYDKTPQRKLAKAAPFSKSPVPLSVKERWGTNWCWPDPKYEGVLPIDDSDMGCSCKGEKCEIREA